jgi:thioredoxin reductase (NADPH)
VEFLVRNRIPHEWLDPDADSDVECLLQEFDIVPRDLPVVIVSGKVLRRPTPGVLADYLGLTVGTMPAGGFDLIVVGAGPAGLAAALYGASEGLPSQTFFFRDFLRWDFGAGATRRSSAGWPRACNSTL